MAIVRRLTINPPLTEAEFAGFRAAFPGLKINREPSGVITVKRKRKGRDDSGAWLLSGRGIISSKINLDDDERQIGRAKINHIGEDNENLQALEALEGRLTRERETSEGAHAAALNVAIRALISHKDILETLMAHERGMPRKFTGRDMDTYDQRRNLLTDAGQIVERHRTRRNWDEHTIPDQTRPRRGHRAGIPFV